eukprot:1157779-Pelagomonas_calceolata.AAC.1
MPIHFCVVSEAFMCQTCTTRGSCIHDEEAWLESNPCGHMGTHCPAYVSELLHLTMCKRFNGKPRTPHGQRQHGVHAAASGEGSTGSAQPSGCLLDNAEKLQKQGQGDARILHLHSCGWSLEQPTAAIRALALIDAHTFTWRDTKLFGLHEHTCPHSTSSAALLSSSKTTEKAMQHTTFQAA